MANVKNNMKKRNPVARTSPNFLGEQVERLKELFPETVADGKVDFEKLKTTLGEIVDDGPERYSFTWAGKLDAVRLLQVPSRATLIPRPKESVDWGTTKNVFIEGENLEVLKLLYKSYAGRVKMIYIDPPYNTGKDFIYPDNFIDPLDTYLKITGQKDSEGNLLTSNPETSGRFHSVWLSMMYPRLFVARQLLSENGLIFVSIDDNELYNLRIIMNEIFGEENFVAQFVWNTEGHTDNQFDVKVNHEYILLYARNWAQASLGRVIDPNTREESNLWKGFAENSITKNGPKNPPTEVILPKGFPCKVDTLDLPASNVPEDFFRKVREQGYISRQITKEFRPTYPLRKDPISVRDSMLEHDCRVYSGWANVNKLQQFIEGECVPLVDGDDNKMWFYLSEGGVIYYKRERREARYVLSVLRNMGTVERMRSELESMGIPYDYPKPKELLKYIIKCGMDKKGIIIDFFAGSCTTSQALLELHIDEGLAGSFIVVQLPEPVPNGSPAEKAGFHNIAQIGKERIRRVSKKLKDDIKNQKDMFKDRETPEDLGLRVFKLTNSNYRQWRGVEDIDEDEYAEEMGLFTDSLLESWKTEDVIWEVAIKEGYSLSSTVEELNSTKDNSVWRVTDQDRGQSFFICLDDTLNSATVRALKLGKEDLFVCRDAAVTDEQAANLALTCQLKTL